MICLNCYIYIFIVKIYLHHQCETQIFMIYRIIIPPAINNQATCIETLQETAMEVPLTQNADLQHTASTSNDTTYHASTSKNDPCPLCGRSDHPVSAVNKLSAQVQSCFQIPNLVSNNNDKPKSCINKLARTMTDHDIMNQIIEKEEKQAMKTERKVKRTATLTECPVLQKNSKSDCNDDKISCR